MLILLHFYRYILTIDKLFNIYIDKNIWAITLILILSQNQFIRRNFMLKLTKFMRIMIILLTVFILLPYASAEEQAKININTASLEELIKLDRVGLKYAQRIIDYRENVAPFSQPEDIMKVGGIGLKTFEANKEVIAVE